MKQRDYFSPASPINSEVTHIRGDDVERRVCFAEAYQAKVGEVGLAV
jgi:hypothetical protein